MPSDLEGIAPELLNNVLTRLVGPNGPDPTPREFPINSYTWRVRNKPSFDTPILATNKYLHAISKSTLDLTNQWVVFDIEHVYLLLPWIFAVIPIILIDPEAAYAIPEGIMHVRVNQFLSNSGVAS
jgi:hypothetical protein